MEVNNKIYAKEASCMNEVFSLIDSFLKNKKSSCWIAFDVDYTITTPALNIDNVEMPITKENFIQAFSEIKCKTKEEIDIVLSSVLFTSNILVDQKTPEIIKELQKRDNVTVFALTACLYTRKIENIRFNTLNAHGINFQNAFEVSELILDKIPIYHKHFPKYSNGIIYANGENGSHNKGMVMEAFMKKMQKVPQIFMIVDDRRKNIEDLYAIFSKEYPDVEFFGILYHPKNDFQKIQPEILSEQISKIASKMTNN